MTTRPHLIRAALAACWIAVTGCSGPNEEAVVRTTEVVTLEDTGEKILIGLAEPRQTTIGFAMRCEEGEPSADIFLGQNGRTQERLRFTVQTPDDRSTMLGVTEWSRTNAKVKIRAGKLLSFLATALNGEGFVSNGITGYLMDLDEQSRQRIRTFIGRCRGPAEPWPKIGGQARRPNRNDPGDNTETRGME